MIFFARPLPHLARTQAALQAAGISSILSTPLSMLVPRRVPRSPWLPPATTALILTSPLAVSCLIMAHSPYTNLTVYAVGEETARAARAAGYTVALTGGNNGLSLAQTIAAMPLPPQHFVHLHGAAVTPPLPWYSWLAAAGHTVTPWCLYGLEPTPALPAPIQTALRQNPPTHTLLFSAQSATHLANLLKNATIAPTGTAIAISATVAEAALTYWPQTVIAPAPTLEAMVTTLGKELNT